MLSVAPGGPGPGRPQGNLMNARNSRMRRSHVADGIVPPQNPHAEVLASRASEATVFGDKVTQEVIKGARWGGHRRTWGEDVDAGLASGEAALLGGSSSGPSCLRPVRNSCLLSPVRWHCAAWLADTRGLAFRGFKTRFSPWMTKSTPHHLLPAEVPTRPATLLPWLGTALHAGPTGLPGPPAWLSPAR